MPTVANALTLAVIAGAAWWSSSHRPDLTLARDLDAAAIVRPFDVAIEGPDAARLASPRESDPGLVAAAAAAAALPALAPTSETGQTQALTPVQFRAPTPR